MTAVWGRRPPAPQQSLQPRALLLDRWEQGLVFIALIFPEGWTLRWPKQDPRG